MELDDIKVFEEISDKEIKALNSLITFKAKDLVRFLEADLENF
jgi:hypothetical protein